MFKESQVTSTMFMVITMRNKFKCMSNFRTCNPGILFLLFAVMSQLLALFKVLELAVDGWLQTE